MNIQKADILTALIETSYTNQRSLAEKTGYSVGLINKILRELRQEGKIDRDFNPTLATIGEYQKKIPKNAIILAAGMGMRMIPINLSSPKALLEVHGEILIERIIRFLHEVDIKDITVVVGFMKESFDYLVDKYKVKLVVNPDYILKNNLSSLSLVSNQISNTYIVPSDIWCKKNPFRKNEMHSWYMVANSKDFGSDVRVNRKRELVSAKEGNGNTMIGISYLSEEDAEIINNKINNMNKSSMNNDDFWEMALYDKGKMLIPARVVDETDFIEINTFEQLRKLDMYSSNLKSNVFNLIANVFGTEESNIKDVKTLKKGMTNRSFVFSINNTRYIMRIPGEGTEKLINREQEVEVYETIKGYHLCDSPLYINSENGYKITKFLENTRVCDAENIDDLNKCMEKLRNFHALKLKVGHSFDLFQQIDFYESLFGGAEQSMYRDYNTTKSNVLKLKNFIDSLEKDWCLTHIDAVSDNFLFYYLNNNEGARDDESELLQLTDWEYAGMQDPHVDIAMFCIYSLYNKEKIDRLIDIYFQNNCTKTIRTKIYAYIAICGLLWSNWCEYKAKLGVEFGEYSLRQYRYAKDYFEYAIQGINKYFNKENSNE